MRTPAVESGWEFYYHYDAAGRLLQINDSGTHNSGTKFVTYTYNELGQSTSRTYANDSYTTYAYLDEINWLSSVVNSESDDTTISNPRGLARVILAIAASNAGMTACALQWLDCTCKKTALCHFRLDSNVSLCTTTRCLYD